MAASTVEGVGHVDASLRPRRGGASDEEGSRRGGGREPAGGPSARAWPPSAASPELRAGRRRVPRPRRRSAAVGRGRVAEERLELASGTVVPGSRIRSGRRRADAGGLGSIPGRLELGDPIQDRSIQPRELLGGRVGLHRTTCSAHDRADGNSPAVPSAGSPKVCAVQSPGWAPLRTMNGPRSPVGRSPDGLDPVDPGTRPVRARSVDQEGLQVGPGAPRRGSGRSHPARSAPSRTGRCVEPIAGRSSGTRHPGRGRGRRRRGGRRSVMPRATTLRPGQRQVVEDELGGDVAGQEDAGPAQAVQERGQRRARPGRRRWPTDSSSRRGSRRDVVRPRRARTRSRATSVQIATTASAARRRSAAGVRAGPSGRRRTRRRWPRCCRRRRPRAWPGSSAADRPGRSRPCADHRAA